MSFIPDWYNPHKVRISYTAAQNFVERVNQTISVSAAKALLGVILREAYDNQDLSFMEQPNIGRGGWTIGVHSKTLNLSFSIVTTYPTQEDEENKQLALDMAKALGLGCDKESYDGGNHIVVMAVQLVSSPEKISKTQQQKRAVARIGKLEEHNTELHRQKRQQIGELNNEIDKLKKKVFMLERADAKLQSMTQQLIEMCEEAIDNFEPAEYIASLVKIIETARPGWYFRYLRFKQSGKEKVK
jgi:hypothetical protein